jgi:hypothetical protein
MLMKDQEKMKELLGVLGAQAAAGVPLTAQQRSAFGAFWTQYSAGLHHHHDNEEYIAFPYISEVKKAIVPVKACADHVALLKDLAVCEALAKDIIDGTVVPSRESAALAELLGHFTALDADLTQHYLEEESTLLAPMRKAITPRENAKHITKPIVSKMDPLFRGQYFSKLDADQLKAFMRQEKIPFFVKYIVFRPNVRKYNRMVANPVEEAIASARAAAGSAPATAA